VIGSVLEGRWRSLKGQSHILRVANRRQEHERHLSKFRIFYQRTESRTQRRLVIEEQSFELILILSSPFHQRLECLNLRSTLKPRHPLNILSPNHGPCAARLT